MNEAAKPTQTRRILRLFYPYRIRLSGLLAMIVISAGISLISPFLLRDLLDNVLSKGENLDTTRLALLVGISFIANGVGQFALGWIMHGLREDVESPAYGAGATA